MPALDDEVEIDLLKRRARELGLYLNEHKAWDPTLGNGSLYIMPARTRKSEHVDSLAKFLTIEQAWQFLHEYANELMKSPAA